MAAIKSSLPAVPGPKLAPFTPTARANIKFLENLGHAKDKDGFVWKVEIEDRGTFALKLFPFMHWVTLRDSWAEYLARPLQTSQLYYDYLSPFNAECRAYGRLKQENREDLAVKAFGYLDLTPEQEADVTQRMLDDGWEPESLSDDDEETDHSLGHPMWNRYKYDRDQPIKAIVKELVVDEDGGSAVGFTPNDISQMWEDLQGLQRLGILVRDIHLRNYVAGKLVDFGRAWTMFHPCLDQIHPYYLKREREGDLFAFQELLIDYWYNEEVTTELEWPKGYTEARDDIENFGIDPRDYDWRKWEESREDADAYVALSLYGDKKPWDSDDEPED
ncbi:kinetochore Sim4 complex subunit FTA2-domain-containing protein [Apiosordaria backusii]|uniref:Kinetochore Sim4 complex subunit FTA2-domain-containing protein n=1 Tax=Apiosordaria backusii TaxID=314023 RepID=A0AA40K3M6_9PEZI|nr:kinetochore Sim4 complex subunit FTA2-domain-containing protein [Apiosordaria backusii]